MIAVDSNILIRYFIEDNPIQAEKARELIDEAFIERTPIWVSDIVLCEMVWVLESSYRVNRKSIAELLRRVADSFDLADPAQVSEAIRKYERGPADFSDYLLGQLGRKSGALTTYTFDGALRTEPNFTLLK